MCKFLLCPLQNPGCTGSLKCICNLSAEICLVPESCEGGRSVLLTAKAQGVAPARDETLSASLCTGSGQSYSGHSGTEGHRGRELDQHDVIVQGP